MAKEPFQTRRKFLKKTALGSFATLLGAEVVFAMPKGYIPLALQEVNDPYRLFGKHKDMVVLNDQPWNVESQAHILDDYVTPADKMFIRNNGHIPEKTDVEGWTLTVKGESVTAEKTYTLQELKTKFPKHTYHLVLECGGNGRSEFYPPAEGNQWTVGAVSCAEWTGVRLRDILDDVGIKNNAVYVGYHATDTHLSRDPNKESISRGVPIAKAMEDETLIAFQMNGKDIPLEHGYPLRMIASGFPASVSGKWLKALSVRDKVHDGEKMAPPSYSIPCDPVEPGAEVPNESMCVIEKMPVKSLITYPKSGAMIKENTVLDIRGHAWTGEDYIEMMEYSIDFGATWHPCSLQKGKNKYAWQRFSAKINFPKKGYYEVWAKAKDNTGVSQPMLSPSWNPKGYVNNACHRIAIKVT